MSLVVVSAAPFEVEPLCAGLKGRRLEFQYVSCGIGALAAAKNARELAKRCENRDTLFVGTCGSFSKFDQPKLVTTSRVIWSPTCERLGSAYRVAQTDGPYVIKKSPAWIKALPEKTVACSSTISLTAVPPQGEVSDDLVENLELYSCVAELEKACRSLAVILCITNEIGSNAHAQWKRHVNAAAELTKEFVCNGI